MNTMWAVYENGATYQVIPENDIREHEHDLMCWCRPEADRELPQMWIHNSADGRENTIEKGVVQ